MKRVVIRLLNWAKYNEKRKDVKHPSWLRLEHDFPISPSMYGVPAEERYVLVALMCLAGKRQSETLEFDPGWFCHFAGGCFDERTLLSALARMDGKCLEVQVAEHVTLAVRTRNVRVTSTSRERDEHVPDTPAPAPSTLRDGRTDGRDEHDERTDDDEPARAREASASSSVGTGQGQEEPSPLPAAFETPAMMAIRKRWVIPPEFLRFWLAKASVDWLAEKIAEWNAEAGSTATHAGKDGVVRLRQYLTKHLGYAGNPRQPAGGAGPPPPIPLKRTGVACRAGYAPSDPNTIVCLEHTSDEVCELEKRGSEGKGAVA